MGWGWNSQRPAGVTTRLTAVAEVHAVRRVADPDGTGARYAIELTVTPGEPSCSACDLVLACEGVAAAGLEVGVAAARIWQGEAWQEADGEPLAGVTRVRLLVTLPDLPGAGWCLRLGTDLLGSVDLARALPLAPPEASDPFDVRGDCARCGSYTGLGRSGHCRPCQTEAPCVAHPGTVSAARCLGCRAAFCGNCLANGHCPACRESAAGRRHFTGKGRASTAETTRRVLRGAVGTVKRRQRLLVGLVLAAALLKAGHLGYEAYTTPVIVLTDAQRLIRDMETVAGALGAMRQQGGLPKDAGAIATFMDSAGITDAPPVIDAGKPLNPGAVVYTRYGDTFTLNQVDAAGQLVMVDGKPLALKSGAD